MLQAEGNAAMYPKNRLLAIAAGAFHEPGSGYDRRADHQG